MLFFPQSSMEVTNLKYAKISFLISLKIIYFYYSSWKIQTIFAYLIRSRAEDVKCSPFISTAVLLSEFKKNNKNSGYFRK